MAIVAVARETAAGERRVALVPESVGRLVRAGVQVRVEAGAGAGALIPDQAYTDAGASVVSGPGLFEGADVVVRVRRPSPEEAADLPGGCALIALLQPGVDDGVQAVLAERGIAALALEKVPRITRAQSMDVLSSQSTVAGYKAVLIGAAEMTKFLPMLTTAAGAIPPGKVFVLGAGVAGLQAIATARRLGAVVSAYDVRAAAAEQVLSLGARFVELALETGDAEDRGGYAKALAEEQQRRQLELLAPHIGEADVVIATALIPGRPAPLLVTEDAVGRMAPGSVIVDLAAPNGGNCALTQPGAVAESGGVRIYGPLNLAAEMPLHASQMYARTVGAMIDEFTRDGAFAPDEDDEIFREACVTRGGEVVHARVREKLGPS
jgi:H+-translocating NAD(P) transhydrogenase subunit alpha